jgi:hypothetical protein
MSVQSKAQQATADEALLSEAQRLAEQIGAPFAGSNRGVLALSFLLAATTEEEHRLGAAEVTDFLMWVARGGKPFSENRPCVDARLLPALIARPPRRGPGKKQPRTRQAMLDALTYCWSERGTLLVAINLLAQSEGITEAAARKRINKAERVSGIKLKRDPQAFRGTRPRP